MTNQSQESIDRGVALVTGAGSGVGEATAARLASSGFRVALVDIERERVEAVAERLADAHGKDRARAFTLDVADADAVADLFDGVVESFGGLDYVAHSAGILGPLALIEDSPVAEIDRVLNVNLKGSYLVLHNAVRVMKAGKGGGITLVGSIAAAKGSALYPVYSATKAAVVALAKSVARNAGRFNIRINTVSPGSILGTRLTDSILGGPAAQQHRMVQAIGLMKLIPVGHAAKSDDVAELIHYLALPEARHIHGADLTIDGGESLGFEPGLSEGMAAAFGLAKKPEAKVA